MNERTEAQAQPSGMSVPGYSVPPLQWDKERDEPFLEITHRGERYLLTMWREEDEKEMIRNWNHPEVGKWSFRRPYPYTRAHFLESIEMFLHPDRDHLDLYRTNTNAGTPTPSHQGRYLLRALRTSEGKMIGNLDLFDIPEEGRWEIAYDLDPDYWGKGLGGMMVGSLVQWAGVIGVKLISTRVDTRNTASEKVLIKNGFELKLRQWNDLPPDKGPGEVEFGQFERAL